jgi:anion-transporting  ArsA/GET3 family ATPase
MSVLGTALEGARVVVCVGSGGVGKTTTAALVGIEAARRGQRVLVMTVDPARRLATSLGVRGLDHEEQRIDLSTVADVAPTGELWATMLDMKRTFDAIVERTAPNADTRNAILNNRFYHFFSTGLAGAQELSASERLFEVVSDGRWDLVVLDTPPSTNALDFFDAPNRFFDALDSKAVQWIMQASSGSLLGMGAQFLLRTLSRFTGAEFFTELGAFLSNFHLLLDGFRDRSAETEALFRSPSSRFVLVTAPDPATVDEALRFRDRLASREVRLSAVVANRVRGEQPPAAAALGVTALASALRASVPELGEAAAQLAERLHLHAEALAALGRRDRAMLDALQAAVGPDVPMVRVPLYPTDVHSLAGLARMRRDLFAA